MSNHDNNNGGMTRSMISSGRAIEEEFPDASEKVGRMAIKAGMTALIGHGAAGEVAGQVSRAAVGSEFAKAVGSGVIGGAVTGVAGLALTAALPFIGLYALGKWVLSSKSQDHNSRRRRM